MRDVVQNLYYTKGVKRICEKMFESNLKCGLTKTSTWDFDYTGCSATRKLFIFYISFGRKFLSIFSNQYFENPIATYPFASVEFLG